MEINCEILHMFPICVCPVTLAEAFFTIPFNIDTIAVS
jgi:hypothetical protein